MGNDTAKGGKYRTDKERQGQQKVAKEDNDENKERSKRDRREIKERSKREQQAQEQGCEWTGMDGALQQTGRGRGA